jgi:outer membrane protein
VGLAPITDVHEARARYDSARANAISSGNALDDAREALSEITGQPIENIKGLASNYQPQNEDTRTSEEWVKIALDSNPALKSKELALAAANKDVETARAGHLPTLSGSLGYSDGATWGTSSNFPPDSTSDGRRAAITLSIPLFSGFATQSRVRQAINQRDIATDQLEQQKRTITRSARNAYRSLVSGQAEVEARRLAVVSAQAAYEAGEAGLEVGTRTIVDVLIAQQQLYSAQREYARARHAFLVNTLRLRQAAGVLELSDVQNVNRSLTVDAEAALINN